jgi:hypothetical protein
VRCGHLTMLGLDHIAQLQTLKDRAQFPRDMTSSVNAKLKCKPTPKIIFRLEILGTKQTFGIVFRDCEDLIRAIQKSKGDKIDNIFDKYIGIMETELSYHWHQLRHYLGRLHSLRQASEAIVQAFKEWPKLFKDFTVNYISSSRPRKFGHPRALNVPPKEIIKAAFPGYDTSHYESDIEELREHGLHEQIQKQEQEFPSKTQVHGEVNLHNHLMTAGKTRTCDLWEGVMFIATSKPPCRLCYYYFQDGDNDFQVQPSHMNLYPKWQLPNIVDPNDDASIEHRTELIEDILEHMREDTLRILQKKFPQWKRNDSRTDSRNWPESLRNGADSRTPVSGNYMDYLSPIAGDGSYMTDMETENVGVAFSQ